MQSSSSLFQPSATDSLFGPRRRPTAQFSRSQMYVKMQLEFRPPPLKLTPERFTFIKNKHDLSKELGLSSPFPPRRAVIYPSRTNSLARNDNPSMKTLVDTADDPLMEQLRRFKEECLADGTIHKRFWIPNPAAIDSEFFDIKTITYALNLEHQGELDEKGVRKSSGGDKAIQFLIHTGLGRNPESVNALYNLLACDLANPEKSLYEVSSTDRHMQAKYLTAFQSCAPDGEPELYFIDHSWRTDFVTPDKEDLKNFKSSQLIYGDDVSMNMEHPFIDGWAQINTFFARPRSELSRVKKSFVDRRYGPNNRDVTIGDPLPQKNFDLWRIPGKKELIKHSDDWRKAIPAYSVHFPKESPEFIRDPVRVFLPLPKINFQYNAENYPLSPEFPSEESGTPVALLPYGQFYGVVE